MRLNFVLGKEKAKKKKLYANFYAAHVQLEVQGGFLALAKLLQKYFNRKLQVH